MKTIKDVMRYCEGRAGTRIVVYKGIVTIVPCGGGLYALEMIADENAKSFPKAWYRQQRIELELLMMEIHKGRTK